MTTALVPLADGFEEMEAVIVIDVLRRAKWQVTAAGITPGIITASRNVHLVPDADWSTIDPDAFDVLVIPGGAAGVKTLAADQRVLAAVQSFYNTGRWLAAICAGPLVLQAAGILSAASRITCHPAAAAQLTAAPRRPATTITDGRLITSQGPGTAFEFALTIVAAIDGQAVADAVAETMVL